MDGTRMLGRPDPEDKTSLSLGGMTLISRGPHPPVLARAAKFVASAGFNSPGRYMYVTIGKGPTKVGIEVLPLAQKRCLVAT